MKTMGKWLTIAVALIAVCLGTAVKAEAAIKTSIVLLQSIDSMEKGSSYSFQAKVKNGENEKIVWKSSNQKVVQVKSNGKVKAKAAGNAVITAMAGKQSITKEVMVYPSLKDICKANDVKTNLTNGVYSSIAINTKDENYTWEEIAVKEKNNEYMVLSCNDNKTEVLKGNLKYSYENKSGLVSIYAAKQETASENIFCPYQVFSNEKITDVKEEGDNYRIFTSSDVSKMTEEEQEQIVGKTEGEIQKEIVVDKKTNLLQEYTYTILFDLDDPDFCYINKREFSYHQDISEKIPEAVNLVMNTKNTRTITVINHLGTKEEKKDIYTIPDTMPLYIIDDGTVYYKDKACMEEFVQAEKNADGTYQSYTLYVK